MRAGGPVGSGSKSQSGDGTRTPSVSYLIDNHFVIPRSGSKNFSPARGLHSGRRLLRNRSLRLHGVLEMLGRAFGSCLRR